MARKKEPHQYWNHNGNKVRLLEENGTLWNVMLMFDMDIDVTWQKQEVGGFATPINTYLVDPEQLTEWTDELECKYQMDIIFQKYGVVNLIKAFHHSLQGCESAGELELFADRTVELFLGFCGEQLSEEDYKELRELVRK